MATVSYSSREIDCKLVYAGPGLSGKTTNVKFIHSQIPSSDRGKLISLATGNERTLFFDFLPINTGTIYGFKVRLHLYSVPGQAMYTDSRQLILQGVDGIIFVADSQRARMDANIASLRDLRAFRRELILITDCRFSSEIYLPVSDFLGRLRFYGSKLRRLVQIVDNAF